MIRSAPRWMPCRTARGVPLEGQGREDHLCGESGQSENRVRSYVREDKNRSPKVAAMIRHAEDLDITMTATEMEALILECNLIKELHPKYNISSGTTNPIPMSRSPARNGPAFLSRGTCGAMTAPIISAPLRMWAVCTRRCGSCGSSTLSAPAGACGWTGRACSTICISAAALQGMLLAGGL